MFGPLEGDADVSSLLCSSGLSNNCLAARLHRERLSEARARRQGRRRCAVHFRAGDDSRSPMIRVGRRKRELELRRGWAEKDPQRTQHGVPLLKTAESERKIRI
jgi:hypothetical protein